MRLLVISDNPDRASFRQRIGLYLDRLHDEGIVCEVATLPGGMLAHRRVFARSREFDGVLLQRKILTMWDAFWLRRCARKVIYDFDDAIMYSNARPERVSVIRFRRFLRTARLSRLIIVGNEYLAEHARRCHERVRILPTGLDLGAYKDKTPRSDDGIVRLVWIGGPSQIKHLVGIGPALEEVGRRFENVRLRIICNRFFDLSSMAVEKRAWSQPTEAADLQESDIGLAPLSDDRFTRGKCGFKILQYYAAGLPVVASPVGVNAAYLREGVTGRLAGGMSEWAECLSQLVSDAQLRRRMGAEGLRMVGDYDAAVIGPQFVDLVRACLQDATP